MELLGVGAGLGVKGGIFRVVARSTSRHAAEFLYVVQSSGMASMKGKLVEFNVGMTLKREKENFAER